MYSMGTVGFSELWVWVFTGMGTGLHYHTRYEPDETCTEFASMGTPILPTEPPDRTVQYDN